MYTAVSHSLLLTFIDSPVQKMCDHKSHQNNDSNSGYDQVHLAAWGGAHSRVWLEEDKPNAALLNTMMTFYFLAARTAVLCCHGHQQIGWVALPHPVAGLAEVESSVRRLHRGKRQHLSPAHLEPWAGAGRVCPLVPGVVVGHRVGHTAAGQIHTAALSKVLIIHWNGHVHWAVWEQGQTAHVE